MSHLSNALATAQQLYDRNSKTALPPELQDSIRYSVARLTQAAGILLRLPQDVAAQAIVTLHRYMLAADMMEFEFSASPHPPPRAIKAESNIHPRTSPPPQPTSQPKSPPPPAPSAASPTSTPTCNRPQPPSPPPPPPPPPNPTTSPNPPTSRAAHTSYTSKDRSSPRSASPHT